MTFTFEPNRPEPIAWLTRAAQLPGKSLHAGLVLWLEAVRLNSRSIPLSNLAVTPFGLDRNSKYRALNWLETAGLISVKREVGRAPLVTLLGAGARGEPK